MIQLTRLNGNPLYVNPDLIKWAEAAPDTMLTLINGEKVVVSEPCAEVVTRMIEQRVRLLAELACFLPDAERNLRGVAAVSVPHNRDPADRPNEAESERNAESG
jgi:flagellar protein FlbD